jgi:hypothetical protein
VSDAVIVASIAAMSAVMVAGLGIVAVLVQRTHTAINGRMTELLELTRKSSKAEGYKEGESHK